MHNQIIEFRNQRFRKIVSWIQIFKQIVQNFNLKKNE